MTSIMADRTSAITNHVPGRLLTRPCRSNAVADPLEGMFIDTFPDAAWIDPVTRKRIAFKDLNPSARLTALAGMGFNRDSALSTAKQLAFRAYARECMAHLERKIHDSNSLERAKARLYQRLKSMAQSIGLPTGAADVEPDEWYEN